MGQRKNNQQPINCFSGANHKGFEAHIHFLLLEHDLDLPAMGIMVKEHLIRQGTIRANEHAQRVFIAKGILEIREQDDSFVNSVERPFITMNSILMTAHCNKVVLIVWEHGGVVLGATAMPVRVKNTVGFHSGDSFQSLVPQGFAGVPAVRLDDDLGACLRQSIQKSDSHFDFGAAFRTATAQAVA